MSQSDTDKKVERAMRDLRKANEEMLKVTRMVKEMVKVLYECAESESIKDQLIDVGVDAQRLEALFAAKVEKPAQKLQEHPAAP